MISCFRSACSCPRDSSSENISASKKDINQPAEKNNRTLTTKDTNPDHQLSSIGDASITHQNEDKSIQDRRVYIPGSGNSETESCQDEACSDESQLNNLKMEAYPDFAQYECFESLKESNDFEDFEKELTML